MLPGGQQGCKGDEMHTGLQEEQGKAAGVSQWGCPKAELFCSKEGQPPADYADSSGGEMHFAAGCIT